MLSIKQMKEVQEYRQKRTQETRARITPRQKTFLLKKAVEEETCESDVIRELIEEAITKSKKK